MSQFLILIWHMTYFSPCDLCLNLSLPSRKMNHKLQAKTQPSNRDTQAPSCRSRYKFHEKNPNPMFQGESQFAPLTRDHKPKQLKDTQILGFGLYRLVQLVCTICKLFPKSHQENKLFPTLLKNSSKNRIRIISSWKLDKELFLV